MSLEIQKISNFIQGTIQANYATASRFTIGCGALCAVVATEAALRAINDIFMMCSHKRIMVYRIKQLSIHLGSAILCVVSALNILSGSAVATASLFTLYAIHKDKENDDYLMTSLMQKSFKVLVDDIAIPVIRQIDRTVRKILR